MNEVKRLREIIRLKRELKSLGRLEIKYRRAAERVAAPFHRATHRTHLKWVKVYNRLKDLERPKTLDDAFGESTTLHGCNPCH